MGKLLFLVFAAVTVFLVLKFMARLAAARKAEETAISHARDRSTETMVSCAACGVNFPRDEAICAGSKFFCCEEHHQQAANRPG